MASSDSSLPYHVEFLLSPEIPLDFHITVGNPESNSMQRFGVDKWMLIARSKVLRVMLLESELRHNEEFTITDMDPETFKHFLVFLYGHDNTATLSFEDAIDLLTAAEKYDVPDLKAKLGEVIQHQVTADNVFEVLQEAPTCETVPALWKAVTNIIQSKTSEVFNQYEFLTATPQVVLHIIQQDTLSVPEIDVWRAALTWAKRQARLREDIISPQTLRSTLLPLLKHIRLCTLSAEHLVKEVISTKVLTADECVEICQSKAVVKKCESLVNVCNEIVKRGSKICKTNGELSDISCNYSTLVLTTNKNHVELCDIVCQANGDPDGSTYRCEGYISIYFDTANKDIVPFNQTVESGGEIVIPLTHNSSNMILDANTRYKVDFRFYVRHKVYANYCGQNMICVDGFKLSDRLCTKSYYSGNHFKILHYKIIR